MPSRLKARLARCNSSGIRLVGGDWLRSPRAAPVPSQQRLTPLVEIRRRLSLLDTARPRGSGSRPDPGLPCGRRGGDEDAGPNSHGPAATSKNMPQLTLLNYASGVQNERAMSVLISAGADPLFEPRQRCTVLNAMVIVEPEHIDDVVPGIAFEIVGRTFERIGGVGVEQIVNGIVPALACSRLAPLRAACRGRSIWSQSTRRSTRHGFSQGADTARTSTLSARSACARSRW